ncbi:MAG: ATP-dependent zinc protease [Mangrovibacterium sp.]
MKAAKIIIGRREIVDFPNLQLEGIEAKIDTGAYTSSIHCHEVKEENCQGETLLRCRFLDPSHPEYNEKELYFSDYSIKKVRSSNGQVESRFKVKTTIVLFGNTYPIQLTLSERSQMKYSVLIGRRFLKGKFVVDVDKAPPNLPEGRD